MKKSFILISTILMCLISSGQDDKIKNIQERYYQIENESDAFNIHHIELNFMLPAVGPKTKSLKFYYSSIQSDPETDPYLMNYRLQKITVSFNVSAHSQYNYEYLYSDTGELIFYYEYAEGMIDNYQKRFYYENEKLIKSIIQIEETETGKISKTSKLNQFNTNEINDSKIGTKKSKEYYSLFKQFATLDQID